MFHVKHENDKFYVAFNEMRVSHLYSTPSAADSALHRMLRTRVAEYLPRDGAYSAFDVHDALQDEAWTVHERARELRQARRLAALPPVDVDVDDLPTLIALGNVTAAQRGWPEDVRDQLRALAFDAPDIEVARAVYW